MDKSNSASMNKRTERVKSIFDSDDSDEDECGGGFSPTSSRDEESEANKLRRKIDEVCLNLSNEEDKLKNVGESDNTNTEFSDAKIDFYNAIRDDSSSSKIVHEFTREGVSERLKSTKNDQNEFPDVEVPDSSSSKAEGLKSIEEGANLQKSCKEPEIDDKLSDMPKSLAVDKDLDSSDKGIIDLPQSSEDVLKNYVDERVVDQAHSPKNIDSFSDYGIRDHSSDLKFEKLNCSEDVVSIHSSKEEHKLDSATDESVSHHEENTEQENLPVDIVTDTAHYSKKHIVSIDIADHQKSSVGITGSYVTDHSDNDFIESSSKAKEDLDEDVEIDDHSDSSDESLDNFTDKVTNQLIHSRDELENVGDVTTESPNNYKEHLDDFTDDEAIDHPNSSKDDLEFADEVVTEPQIISKDPDYSVKGVSDQNNSRKETLNLTEKIVPDDLNSSIEDLEDSSDDEVTDHLSSSKNIDLDSTDELVTEHPNNPKDCDYKVADNQNSFKVEDDLDSTDEIVPDHPNSSKVEDDLDSTDEIVPDHPNSSKVEDDLDSTDEIVADHPNSSKVEDDLDSTDEIVSDHPNSSKVEDDFDSTNEIVADHLNSSKVEDDLDLTNEIVPDHPNSSKVEDDFDSTNEIVADHLNSSQVDDDLDSTDEIVPDHPNSSKFEDLDSTDEIVPDHSNSSKVDEDLDSTDEVVPDHPDTYKEDLETTGTDSEFENRPKDDESSDSENESGHQLSSSPGKIDINLSKFEDKTSIGTQSMESQVAENIEDHKRKEQENKGHIISSSETWRENTETSKSIKEADESSQHLNIDVDKMCNKDEEHPLEDDEVLMKELSTDNSSEDENESDMFKTKTIFELNKDVLFDKLRDTHSAKQDLSENSNEVKERTVTTGINIQNTIESNRDLNIVNADIAEDPTREEKKTAKSPKNIIPCSEMSAGKDELAKISDVWNTVNIFHSESRKLPQLDVASERPQAENDPNIQTKSEGRVHEASHENDESDDDDDSGVADSENVNANLQHDHGGKENERVENESINIAAVLQEAKETTRSSWEDMKNNSIFEDFQMMQEQSPEYTSSEALKRKKVRVEDVFTDSEGDEPSKKFAAISPYGKSDTNKDPENEVKKVRKKRVRATSINLPAIMLAFEKGWVREVVYRSAAGACNKRADVYYYSPSGKKLRSRVEVEEYFTKNNITDLTLQNFSFFKEPLGVEERYEKIRHASSVTTTAGALIKQPALLKSSSVAVAAASEDTNIMHQVFESPAMPLSKKRIRKSIHGTSDETPPSKKAKIKEAAKKVFAKDPLSQTQNPSLAAVQKMVAEGAKGFPTPMPPEGSVYATHLFPSNPPLMQTRILTPMIQGGTRDKTFHCTPSCEGGEGNVPNLQCVKCVCLFHSECCQMPPSTVAIIQASVAKFLCPNCYLEESDASVNLPFTPAPCYEPLAFDPSSESEDEGLCSDYESSNNFKTISIRPKTPPTPVILGASKQHTIIRNPNLTLPNVIAQPPPGQNAAGVFCGPPPLPGTLYGSTMGVPPRFVLLRPMGPQVASPQWQLLPTSVGFPPAPALSSSNQIGGTSFIPYPNQASTSYMQPQPSGAPVLPTPSSLSDSPEQEKENKEKAKEKPLIPQVMPGVRGGNFFFEDMAKTYQVMRHIFSYFSVPDLLVVSRVCLMWRDLALSPSFWQTVRLRNVCVNDWDKMVEFLQRRGTYELDLRKMVICVGMSSKNRNGNISPKGHEDSYPGEHPDIPLASENPEIINSEDNSKNENSPKEETENNEEHHKDLSENPTKFSEEQKCSNKEEIQEENIEGDTKHLTQNEAPTTTSGDVAMDVDPVGKLKENRNENGEDGNVRDGDDIMDVDSPPNGEETIGDIESSVIQTDVPNNEEEEKALKEEAAISLKVKTEAFALQEDEEAAALQEDKEELKKNLELEEKERLEREKKEKIDYLVSSVLNEHDYFGKVRRDSYSSSSSSSSSSNSSGSSSSSSDSSDSESQMDNTEEDMETSLLQSIEEEEEKDHSIHPFPNPLEEVPPSPISVPITLPAEDKKVVEELVSEDVDKLQETKTSTKTDTNKVQETKTSPKTDTNKASVPENSEEVQVDVEANGEDDDSSSRNLLKELCASAADNSEVIKDIDPIYQEWEIIATALGNLHSLRKIVIGTCDSAIVEIILSRCHQLTGFSSLSLGSQSGNDQICFDPSFLMQTRRLEELRLASQKNLVFKSNFNFIKLPHLRVLMLKGLKTTEMGWPYLGIRLTHLYLSSISTFSHNNWLNIQTMTGLIELELDGGGADHDVEFCSAMAKLPNLKYLTLLDWNIGSKLPHTLRRLHNIKYLHIIPAVENQNLRGIFAGRLMVVLESSKHLLEFIWGIQPGNIIMDKTDGEKIFILNMKPGKETGTIEGEEVRAVSIDSMKGYIKHRIPQTRTIVKKVSSAPWTWITGEWR